MSEVNQAREASQYVWQAGALTAGGDLGLCSNCTVAMAEAACTNLTDCRGVTFQSGAKLPASALAKVYLKAQTSGNTDPAWQTYLRQPPFPPKHMPKLPAGVGVDATAAEYPQYTRISDVWVADIGLLQKQSSAYFQAVSCCTTVERMVAFNMPRAAINVNDGAGGNLTIRDSLLTNTCRESTYSDAALVHCLYPNATLQCIIWSQSKIIAFGSIECKGIVT